MFDLRVDGDLPVDPGLRHGRSPESPLSEATGRSHCPDPPGLGVALKPDLDFFLSPAILTVSKIHLEMDQLVASLPGCQHGCQGYSGMGTLVFQDPLVWQG